MASYLTSGIQTEIKNGLDPENEIAEDASFLTDSEGFIKITEDE